MKTLPCRVTSSENSDPPSGTLQGTQMKSLAYRIFTFFSPVFFFSFFLRLSCSHDWQFFDPLPWRHARTQKAEHDNNDNDQDPARTYDPLMTKSYVLADVKDTNIVWFNIMLHFWEYRTCLWSCSQSRYVLFKAEYSMSKYSNYHTHTHTHGAFKIQLFFPPNLDSLSCLVNVMVTCRF